MKHKTSFVDFLILQNSSSDRNEKTTFNKVLDLDKKPTKNWRVLLIKLENRNLCLIRVKPEIY